MKLIFSYLLGAAGIAVNSACYNNDILEKIEINEEINEEYDDYGNIIQITPVAQILRERVKYRTIICSNIFSTESIRYPYVEEDFEQHLKIQDSNISVINQCAFTSFTTITKLFLTSLKIKTILPGAFNGLTRLKELHLNHNNLNEISKGVYNSLHRLEILDLSNNQIYFIEDKAFTGTDSLVKLHFQNNKIESIERSMLNTQRHLSYLDLSQNPLTKVSLEGVSSLDTLNISNSLLQEFNDNLSHLTIKTVNLSWSHLKNVDFALYPKLDEIDLSHNKIESIDNCENLDSVRVDLSYNDIETINGTFGDVSLFVMSHNQLEILEHIMFNASETMMSMDFSFNKISAIQKYAFVGLRLLDELHLQYNNISNIDTIIFKDLSNLRDLNLSHNKLEQFQYGTFDSLSNLQTLDISSNRLTYLNQLVFNSLIHLRTLYFDNNHISSFDAKNLNNHLISLRFVSLDNNPWKCDELVKINQVFKTAHVTIRVGNDYNVENFHGIACQNIRQLGDSLNGYVKSVDENVKNSKLEQFLNEDFHKSKFVQYFDKDYSKSSFFRYLDSYRHAIGNSFNQSNNKMEELIAVRDTSTQSEKNILVFSAICQVVIVFILVCGFFYMSNFLKNLYRNGYQEKLHQMELF